MGDNEGVGKRESDLVLASSFNKATVVELVGAKPFVKTFDLDLLRQDIKTSIPGFAH